MRTRSILSSLLATTTAVAVLSIAGPAGAHTEADAVAVPAGAEATVTFKPGHGCKGSPTIDVAIQVPVVGATGGDVDGWKVEANPFPDGKSTVVEWSGGELADDKTGAFPIHFTPTADQVGKVLLFPAVQTCVNGDNENWINGDPAADNPAPRVLILPEGSSPAATLDDIPADAPGRDLLAKPVIVDPGTATTAATETTAGDGGAAATTPGGGTSADGTSAQPSTDTKDENKTEGDMPWVLVIAIVVAIAGIAAFAISRRAAAKRNAN